MLDIKDVALFLGIFLPVVGSIFAYRSAERNRAREVDKAVQAAPLGVVAAISDRESSLSLTVALIELGDALRKGVAIMREERDDTARKRQTDRLIDEVTALRRELEDIGHVLKQGHE